MLNTSEIPKYLQIKLSWLTPVSTKIPKVWQGKVIVKHRYVNCGVKKYLQNI
jgi:hypothetical protein